MSDTRPVTFTLDAAERIAKVTRLVEGKPVYETAQATPSQLGAGQARPVFVRVTSTTTTSSRYPGKVESYVGDTSTWSDGADCWVIGPNGETLTTQRYLARLAGLRSSDGYPIFVAQAVTAGSTLSVRKNSTGSTYTRGRLNLIEGAGITLTVADDSGDDEVDVTVQSSAASGQEIWTKVSKSYTDFAVAATSADIEIYSLPAKGYVNGVVAKSTTAVAGAGITSWAWQVGITGSLSRWISLYQGVTAVSDTNFAIGGTTTGNDVRDFGSTTSVRLQSVCNVNLNNATQGAVDIYLRLGTLP